MLLSASATVGGHVPVPLDHQRRGAIVEVVVTVVDKRRLYSRKWGEAVERPAPNTNVCCGSTVALLLSLAWWWWDDGVKRVVSTSSMKPAAAAAADGSEGPRNSGDADAAVVTDVVFWVVDVGLCGSPGWFKHFLFFP